jgi:hypothetical protein
MDQRPAELARGFGHGIARAVGLTRRRERVDLEGDRKKRPVEKRPFRPRS